MSTADSKFILRKAEDQDIAQLHELIACSVHGLMTEAYEEKQLGAALGVWLGVDSQLIVDGTYFVVETEERGQRALVGCGGWSKRKTPFGSDHRPDREDALLDPRIDAAKVRAFFVHPDWARRGIGTMILRECEQAARDAGFSRCEMGATLSGVPFYRSHGYLGDERIELSLANGETLPILKMTKSLTETV